MECATVKGLLSEYMDDNLDPDTKARLEDHLVRCKGCTEELASLRLLVQELNSLEPVEAPEDFLDKLRERMDPRFQFHKILRKLFIPARIKIPLEFATVAVMAVLVFFIVHTQEAKKQFLDMPEGTPTVRLAEQHTGKPSPPAFKKEVYKAKPSLESVPSDQKAEETKIIELALLLEADAYTPRAAIEGESHPQKEAKTNGKEKAWQGAPNTETHTDELKQEDDGMQILFMPGSALKDKDERPYSHLNEILSSVKHLIALAEGHVTSVAYEKEAKHPQSIYAEIPAEHYHAFSEELARIAPLQASPPTVSDKDQKVIRVRIRFMFSR